MSMWIRFYPLIKRGRRSFLKLVCALDGGVLYSRDFRRILFDYHGVELGLYSYGNPLFQGVFPTGSRIGRYVSLADGLEVFRRNHPISRLSTHPFFYNSRLGIMRSDSIERVADNPLSIGNDVWIGSRVTLLPGCSCIGNGAIVGAGSVVTRDVEPYSVVAGNPARVIRSRFPVDLINSIEESAWWTLEIESLQAHLPIFLKNLTADPDKDLSTLRTVLARIGK